MDKFLKIFDVAFIVAFALFAAFILVVSPSSTINVTFSAYGFLFFGVLLGIRGFFKTKPFYVRRKVKWPDPYLGLAATAFSISIAAPRLGGPSVLSLTFLALHLILLFVSSKKATKDQKRFAQSMWFAQRSSRLFGRRHDRI